MKKIQLENYFFDSENKKNEHKKLILIIYDIIDNKRRVKFAKLMEGYGFRVQKSAFEGILKIETYNELINRIPNFIKEEDNVRVYRLNLSGEVAAWGSEIKNEDDEVIII